MWGTLRATHCVAGFSWVSTAAAVNARVVLIWLAALVVYAGHFHNSFHFDDSHAVVNNPYVRDWRSIPTLFTDATTFSSLPQNQSYRPLITTSLAIDYWLGGNQMTPLMFHVSTFLWFLLQLALMQRIFGAVGERCQPAIAEGAAWFATAWYALHPAVAETINYVIQRGDVYAALAIVAALYLFIVAPRWRWSGLYLIPVVLGLLSKANAAVFPGCLFIYVWLFEAEDTRSALARCLPALALCAAGTALILWMTPASYDPGATSAYAYWITQPLVIWRYIGALFLPMHLSADSDARAVASIWESGAWLAALSLLGIAVAAIACVRRREWRPVAFGFGWFVIGLLPTSLLPLAEVENDHRMYLPFVGLTFAVTWIVAKLLVSASLFEEREAEGISERNAAQIAARSPFSKGGTLILGVVLLAGYAWGTVHRNEVWRTEESLWHDVTTKSPANGRGLMNYGLTLMAKGDSAGALDYFDRAAVLLPSYAFLEINRGIANGELERNPEARAHFERALVLAPAEARAELFYGRWLEKIGQHQEAITHLQRSIEKNPSYIEGAELLMQILAQQRRWAAVERTATALLARFPNQVTALSYRSQVQAAAAALQRREQLVASESSARAYLELSQSLYQFERFDESIDAARQVLRDQPDSAEAYNNIAAAHAELGRWQDAIAAARAALRIQPGFTLARNNLAWAESENRRATR